MFAIRKRMSLVMFLSLLILANIKTFTGTPFSIIVANIIALQRWSVYTGLILLGLFAAKSPSTEKRAIAHAFHLIYFVIIFMSSVNSINPTLTIERGIAMVLLYGATFYGLYNCIDSHKTLSDICEKMVWLSLAINIIPWFFIEDISTMFIVGRYAGIIRSATGSAAINVFLFPLALSNYYITKKKIHIYIAIFLVALVFISFTRTAFIILILCIIFYYSQHFRKAKYALLTIGTIAILTAIVSFFVFGIWLPARLVRIETLPQMGGRVMAWTVASEIISRRPFAGFGFGTEEFLYDYFDYKLIGHAGKYFHNSFLGLAAQLGIPFTVFYFTGLFLYLFFAIGFTNTITDLTKRSLAIGLNTVIMVGIMYCFSESYIYSAGNFFNFVYLISCAMFLKIVALESINQKSIE